MERFTRRLGALLLLAFSSWMLAMTRLPGEYILGSAIFCGALVAWRFANRVALGVFFLGLAFFVVLPAFINFERSGSTFGHVVMSFVAVVGSGLILVSMCLPRRPKR